VRVVADLGPCAIKLRAEAISLWDVEALITTGFSSVIQRYDAVKAEDGTGETDWRYVFLDWVRCICVLLTGYLRFGDQEEKNVMSAIIVGSSIVPQILAVVHEFWSAERAKKTVDSQNGRGKIAVDAMLHYAATLSRTVCQLPSILSYALAPYWLQWLEGLPVDSAPCKNVADLEQFATGRAPAEPVSAVLVLDTFLNAVASTDADAIDGFLSIGTLPTVVNWMHADVRRMPPAMLFRACKIVKELLNRHTHADLETLSLSDHEIGILADICSTIIDLSEVESTESSTDEDAPVEVVYRNSAKHMLSGICALTCRGSRTVATEFSRFIPCICKFWRLSAADHVLTRDHLRKALEQFFKNVDGALPELEKGAMLDFLDDVLSSLEEQDFLTAIQTMQTIMLALRTKGLGEVLGLFLVSNSRFYELVAAIADCNQRELHLFLPQCLVLGGGANILENASFLPVVLAVMRSVLIRRGAGELQGASFGTGRRYTATLDAEAFAAVITARNASVALACGFLFIRRLWEAEAENPDPELRHFGPDKLQAAPSTIDILSTEIEMQKLCSESFYPLELFATPDNFESCRTFTNTRQVQEMTGSFPSENAIAVIEGLWSSERMVLRSDASTMVRMADCAVQLLYDEDFKPGGNRKVWQESVRQCCKILGHLVTWGFTDGLLSIWANGYHILYCISEWCYEMRAASKEVHRDFTASIRKTVEGIMLQRAGMLSYSKLLEPPKKLRRSEKQLWTNFSRIIEAADFDLSETAGYVQYRHYMEHLQKNNTTSGWRFSGSPEKSSGAAASSKSTAAGRRQSELVYLGQWMTIHAKLVDIMQAQPVDFPTIRDSLLAEVGEEAFAAERSRIMYTLCSHHKIRLAADVGEDADGGDGLQPVVEAAVTLRKSRRGQLLRLFSRKRATGLQG